MRRLCGSAMALNASDVVAKRATKSVYADTRIYVNSRNTVQDAFLAVQEFACGTVFLELEKRRTVQGRRIELHDIERSRTEDEPRPRDLAVFNLVHGDHLELTRAFGEGARNLLVVDHQIPHHDTVDQQRVKVGFLKAYRLTLPQFSRTARQQSRRMLIDLNIIRVGRHQRVDISGIVRIQLALYDGFRVAREIMFHNPNRA